MNIFWIIITVKLQFNALEFSVIPHLALFFRGPVICLPFCMYLKSDSTPRFPAFKALFFTIFFTFGQKRWEKRWERQKTSIKRQQARKFLSQLSFLSTIQGVLQLFGKKKTKRLLNTLYIWIWRFDSIVLPFLPKNPFFGFSTIPHLTLWILGPSRALNRSFTV